MKDNRKEKTMMEGWPWENERKKGKVGKKLQENRRTIPSILSLKKKNTRHCYSGGPYWVKIWTRPNPYILPPLNKFYPRNYIHEFSNRWGYFCFFSSFNFQVTSRTERLFHCTLTYWIICLCNTWYSS